MKIIIFKMLYSWALVSILNGQADPFGDLKKVDAKSLAAEARVQGDVFLEYLNSPFKRILLKVGTVAEPAWTLTDPLIISGMAKEMKDERLVFSEAVEFEEVAELIFEFRQNASDNWKKLEGISVFLLGSDFYLDNAHREQGLVFRVKRNKSDFAVDYGFKKEASAKILKISLKNIYLIIYNKTDPDRIMKGIDSK